MSVNSTTYNAFTQLLFNVNKTFFQNQAGLCMLEVVQPSTDPPLFVGYFASNGYNGFGYKVSKCTQPYYSLRSMPNNFTC